MVLEYFEISKHWKIYNTMVVQLSVGFLDWLLALWAGSSWSFRAWGFVFGRNRCETAETQLENKAANGPQPVLFSGIFNYCEALFVGVFSVNIWDLQFWSTLGFCWGIFNPLQDRIGNLATRAMNWANLRRKSNAELWANQWMTIVNGLGAIGRIFCEQDEWYL